MFSNLLYMNLIASCDKLTPSYYTLDFLASVTSNPHKSEDLRWITSGFVQDLPGRSTQDRLHFNAGVWKLWPLCVSLLGIEAGVPDDCFQKQTISVQKEWCTVIDIKTLLTVHDDTGGRLALWYHIPYEQQKIYRQIILFQRI